MGFELFKKCSRFTRELCLILIVIFLVSLLFQDVAAEHKEFDAEEFKEEITVPRNDMQVIDFNFEKGKAIEIIYTVQVNDELPIDIWFVNEDNYLLLSGGAQFLYLIDGTSQQVSFAKKVVTLTKHGNYKLVMTNYYSNQTVKANIVGEIRTFNDGSEENSSEFSIFIMYILIIIIIILIIVIISLGFKIRKFKRDESIELDRGSGKKRKKDKSKKRKGKNKGASKKEKGKKSRTETIKDAKDAPSDFCGYCGKPADTPFCKHCGHKI